MKEGEVKVLGISKYEKDGKVSYTLHGETPFEQWESEAGAIGTKAVTEWTNKVDLGFLKPGDIIIPIYTKGFKGAAVLNNVTVVSQSK